jgi:hypothetical protein
MFCNCKNAKACDSIMGCICNMGFTGINCEIELCDGMKIKKEKISKRKFSILIFFYARSFNEIKNYK